MGNTTLPEVQQPSDEYVGRCFFYAQDPQAFLTAGYDTIKVFRRKKASDPWVEITTAATRIPIRADQLNYAFVDTKAKASYQYRPSTADSTNVLPDVPQNGFLQDAVDTRYEQVITIQEIRDLYCWGLLGLFQDDEGRPFPDRFYVHYILSAIQEFQQQTSLYVLPTAVEEFHDYVPQPGGFLKLQLDEYPLVSLEEVALVLPGRDPTVLPADWLSTDLRLGTTFIQPGTPFPSSVPFFPSGGRYPPRALRVRYTAGFELGRLPADIKDIIGKKASAGPLNLGGDLVGGAAIASQSMGIDGLSQSVNTTSSATNAGFGSRLIQYANEAKRSVPIVRKFYKGTGRLYVA